MFELNRAGGDDRHDGRLHELPTKQRAIVEAIEAFERVTGEPCSIRLLARRLRVHHSTIQEQLSALHRKGWLSSPNSPLSLRRKI